MDIEECLNCGREIPRFRIGSNYCNDVCITDHAISMKQHRDEENKTLILRCCTICNTPMNSVRRNAKFCSPKCRSIDAKLKREEFGNVALSCTGETGAASELIASVDLMKKGFQMYRALSPASPCDLVAIKDGKVYRIEVKTAVITKSGLSYPLPKDRQFYDILAVVVLSSSDVYYSCEWEDIDLPGISSFVHKRT